MYTGDTVEGIHPGSRRDVNNAKDEPNQLDSKQNHARFNYDEDDRKKFASSGDVQKFLIGGSIILGLTEHLENLEHN